MRNSRSTPQPTFASLITLLVVLFVGLIGQGTAHAGGIPGLSNQASPSGAPAGAKIYDSAMLGGGANPTGFLTFKVYAPHDSTCAAAPLFTTTTPVNGNGYYESSRYTALSAGTYRWTVAYSGDAMNLSPPPTSCSNPSGQVTLSKRAAQLDAVPTWAAPTATATAILSGGGPVGPTGTLTFALYAPGNLTCAGAPIFTSVRSANGSGNYVSGAFNPTLAGSHQWVVNYSGDANNLAAASTCADTSKSFTASVASTVVSGSPATVSRGGTITVTWSGIASPTAGDWVGIYKAGTPNGGTVTAWKYLTGAASGSVSVRFPWAATAGTYEVRMMANNTTNRLATSAPITMVW